MNTTNNNVRLHNIISYEMELSKLIGSMVKTNKKLISEIKYHRLSYIETYTGKVIVKS